MIIRVRRQVSDIDTIELEVVVPDDMTPEQAGHRAKVMLFELPLHVDDEEQA